VKTILVVEDEGTIAGVLCDVLEDEGYQVVVAHNGQEGLARVAEAAPDMVLSDLMMPLLDGHGLCRALQADPRYQAIPIVLMSAGERPASVSGCQYAAFVAKPFDFERLLTTVVAQIGSAEA
jgi:CheY-like chemotaxis protein